MPPPHRKLPSRMKHSVTPDGKLNNKGPSHNTNPISTGIKLNNNKSTITRPELINYIQNRAVAAFYNKYNSGNNNNNLNNLRTMHIGLGRNMLEFNHLVNFMYRTNYNKVNNDKLRKIAIALKGAANSKNVGNQGQVRNAATYLYQH